MEQFKIVHIDDILKIKDLDGNCKGNNCSPKELHNINYTRNGGKCKINNVYIILLRKLSLFFSYFVNHVFTKMLQKNQKNFINKLFIKITGLNYYNM